MENEFEKYLERHRGHFETGSPSPQVWEKLKIGLEDHHRRRARAVRMRRISWGIAACLVLGFGITAAIFTNKGPIKGNIITLNVIHRDSMIDKQKITEQKMEQDSAERIAGVTDNETRQSLYHYSQMIENRQKQMAVLQQVNPGLYARSQRVLEDLNQAYNRLQKQLAGSPDQQKVLKALIQNLKMQEQILNNQLQLLEELQTPDNTSDGKKEKNI